MSLSTFVQLFILIVRRCKCKHYLDIAALLLCTNMRVCLLALLIVGYSKGVTVHESPVACPESEGVECDVTGDSLLDTVMQVTYLKLFRAI